MYVHITDMKYILKGICVFLKILQIRVVYVDFCNCFTIKITFTNSFFAFNSHYNR